MPRPSVLFEERTPHRRFIPTQRSRAAQSTAEWEYASVTFKGRISPTCFDLVFGASFMLQGSRVVTWSVGMQSFLRPGRSLPYSKLATGKTALILEALWTPNTSNVIRLKVSFLKKEGLRKLASILKGGRVRLKKARRPAPRIDTCTSFSESRCYDYLSMVQRGVAAGTNRPHMARLLRIAGSLSSLAEQFRAELAVVELKLHSTRIGPRGLKAVVTEFD